MCGVALLAGPLQLLSRSQSTPKGTGLLAAVAGGLGQPSLRGGAQEEARLTSLAPSLHREVKPRVGHCSFPPLPHSYQAFPEEETGSLGRDRGRRAAVCLSPTSCWGGC